MWTSNSSSMEATERKSSNIGSPFPPFLDESHEDEKMDGPNAFDNPPVGSVSEPDRRRLLRSVSADEATDEATEAE